MIILCIAGLLAVIIILYSIIEQRFLDVTSYEIASDTLPKEYDGISFVVLADLHNCSYGQENKRLIRKIEQLSPDFILVAGDMVVKNKDCYPSVALSLLESLSKRYQVYYGYGNHEQFKDYNNDNSWLEYRARLEDCGVVFLNNQSVKLSTSNKSYNSSRSVEIIGLTIDSIYFSRFNAKKKSEKNSSIMGSNSANSVVQSTMPMNKEYIANLISMDNSNYKILIAHNPDYFENYVEWGADLTVSGHLHGGLVRFPWIGGIVSPQVKLFPTYDAGLFTKDGKNMIVSRGLGSHSIMLRIFNRPEIVSIKLKRGRT